MSAVEPTILVHRGDLPADLTFPNGAAIDTETLGLRPLRDRLCVVQVSAGDGLCHVVHFPPELRADERYRAPNLIRLLTDAATPKLFHYGRFDIAALYVHLGVLTAPVYCTKIASRLVRTYTDRHGLKDLCRELLGVELAKEQQSSDWGASELTPEQIRYAAGDVLYLHRLRDRLDQMLAREGRQDLAAACFEFLPMRARLDVEGWPDEDIFAYKL